MSVVFAMLLWVHVTSNATFSSKCTMPIRYVGPSEGYVIASEKPDEATVVVTGAGRDLVRFYASGLIGVDERYALVNLTGLPVGANTVSIDRDMIHLGMFSELSVDTVLSPNNASFAVDVDRLIKRTIAVDTKSLPEFKVSDSAAILGKPWAKPAYVVMTGPASIIGHISAAKVSVLLKRNLSSADSVVKGYIEKPRYVEVEPDEVELHFVMDQVASRKISGVKLRLSNIPRKFRTAFKPDSLTVVLRGPKSLLSRITANQIIAGISPDALQNALDNDESSIEPSIRLPNGLTGVSVIGTDPKNIELTIKK